MKVVMEHKLNDEQKDEFKAELEEALKDLKGQVEKTFDSWENTKTIFIYTLAVSGAICFGTGYLVGRMR